MTAVATTRTVTEADTAVPPTCRAWAAPPCRRRGMWLVFVATCIHCGGGHSHRVGNAGALLAGKVVRSCPVAGDEYRLSPVHRRREARRPVRGSR